MSLDKPALAQFLGYKHKTKTKTTPPLSAATNGKVLTNTVKGSPRFGKTYIEASIGGKTVHRYAADGSQDVAAPTAAFKPNTTPREENDAAKPKGYVEENDHINRAGNSKRDGQRYTVTADGTHVYADGTRIKGNKRTALKTFLKT